MTITLPRVRPDALAGLCRDVLEAHPHAVVSHETAATLWRLPLPGGDGPRLLHLTGPPGPRERARGVVAHVGVLRNDERSWVGGVRVTSPIRTLLDLGAVLGVDEVVAAVRALLDGDSGGEPPGARGDAEDRRARRLAPGALASPAELAARVERDAPPDGVVRTACTLLGLTAAPPLAAAARPSVAARASAAVADVVRQHRPWAAGGSATGGVARPRAPSAVMRPS